MSHDVADHGVRVAAFGVEIGVGVVFCHAPQAVFLVPLDRPSWLVLEETGDPCGIAGRWEDGHAYLTSRAWPRRRARGRPRRCPVPRPGGRRHDIEPVRRPLSRGPSHHGPRVFHLDRRRSRPTSARRVNAPRRGRRCARRSWWRTPRRPGSPRRRAGSPPAPRQWSYAGRAAVDPGLLQTEEYARAILSARPDGNLDDLDEQVAARLARQAILNRTGAPQLWCVLDEGVLHRAIGGRKVMRSQLYRLAEVAEHPKTTIQVICSSGAHAALLDGFIIADLESKPPVAYLETAAEGQVTDSSSAVGRVALRFDRLRAQAESWAASRDLIGKVAEERWT